MATLNSEQIENALASTADWGCENGNLVRRLQFGDFSEAMRFVNAVAWLAERAAHHPDIDIRYNRVTLALSSHDAGGITDKDFTLAREISALLSSAA